MNAPCEQSTNATSLEPVEKGLKALFHQPMRCGEKVHPPLRERVPANYRIGAAQFVRPLLSPATVGAVGIVVARRPIGIADLAWADYKVTESSAAKSPAAVATHGETTAVETAFQHTTVGSTSIKALALASSKPAAIMSQRFVAGEHQSACN
jgi:hypothetical protein